MSSAGPNPELDGFRGGNDGGDGRGGDKGPDVRKSGNESSAIGTLR